MQAHSAHLLRQLCDLIGDAIGDVGSSGRAGVRAQHHAALVAGGHDSGLNTGRGDQPNEVLCR